MALLGMEFENIGEWGSGQNLPFTAPSNGFVNIYINPSTGAGASGRFVVDGTNIALVTPSGSGVTNCAPIKKGGTVTQSALSGGTATVYFRSFE